MIREIRVRANNIEGTGDTLYDMRDDTFDLLVFQRMMGASFSGAGIAYDIDRNTYTFTVSTEPLQGGIDIVRPGLQLYLNAGDTDSYPGTGTSWYDLSNNAYTATLQNGTAYTAADGGAMTFDGANDYVDVGQSLASESFSVGAWFKNTLGGLPRMILSKETPAGNPWNYRIWLTGGTIVADMSQVATQANLTSPLNTYNDGEWHYVMFTRDDSNWYLYVNGIQVNSRVDPYTGSVTNSQNLWIGRSAYLGGSYPYSGSIGEVFIYNRVLSAPEILQNFDATKTRYGV